MIDGNKSDGYILSCNLCGGVLGEVKDDGEWYQVLFDTWDSAVAFKVNKTNKWSCKMIGPKLFLDLCPNCAGWK